MAKKQKAQILSPENYIRQRARNLPLYKCFINKEWEDTGLSQIIISRKHINGNVTLCFYLVDTDCLGIKDTFYHFNIAEFEMDEMIENISEHMPMTEIEYPIVHNIIHAAWEFADGIGFKPHKDFSSVTQYMLEEDSNAIPLIEIECGDEEGKPVYVRGAFDSEAKANQIVAHLEQTLGKGNYTTILSHDDWEDEEDDFENEFREEYADKSLNELAALYLQTLSSIEDGLVSDYGKDQEKMERLTVLADILYEEIIEEKELNNWFNKWEEEETNLPISKEEFCPEFLGLTQEQPFTKKDSKFLEKAETQEEVYEYILKRWGEVPYAIYLNSGDETLSEETEKRTIELLLQYPDYPLFKIDNLLFKIGNNEVGEECLNYKEIFKNRKNITPIEYMKYTLLKCNYFAATSNLAGIESLFLYLLSFMSDWQTEDREMMGGATLTTKLSVLRNYLTEYLREEKS